jgi:hypothetical protein
MMKAMSLCFPFFRLILYVAEGIIYYYVYSKVLIFDFNLTIISKSQYVFIETKDKNAERFLPPTMNKYRQRKVYRCEIKKKFIVCE